MIAQAFLNRPGTHTGCMPALKLLFNFDSQMHILMNRTLYLYFARFLHGYYDILSRLLHSDVEFCRITVAERIVCEAVVVFEDYPVANLNLQMVGMEGFIFLNDYMVPESIRASLPMQTIVQFFSYF